MAEGSNLVEGRDKDKDKDVSIDTIDTARINIIDFIVLIFIPEEYNHTETFPAILEIND